MSIFSWNKKKNIEEYFPGGRLIHCRLRFDRDTGHIAYSGSYGSSASFNIKDMVHVDLRIVNDKQGIILVQGLDICIGTLDVLPISVCRNIELWLKEKSQEFCKPIGNSKLEEVCSKKIAVGQEIQLSQQEIGNQSDLEVMEALKKLKELKDMDIITDEEYRIKKQKLMDRL